MFSTAKPLASLSSGLLARKGQARPAMRRHMTPAQAGDDLGWNDMGESAADAASAPLPPVLVAREALAEEIETVAEAIAAEPVAAMPVAAAPVSVATAALIQSETIKKAKAAFTLRLDADRHLRLRLASATQGRSSQQLVTQALDAFLATMPDVETLAHHLPSATR